MGGLDLGEAQSGTLEVCTSYTGQGTYCASWGKKLVGAPQSLSYPLFCCASVFWLEVQPAGAKKSSWLCSTNTQAIENGPSDSE